MPNARLERTRASLPEGYQFGDAKPQLTRMYDHVFPEDGVIAMGIRWPSGVSRWLQAPRQPIPSEWDIMSPKLR